MPHLVARPKPASQLSFTPQPSTLWDSNELLSQSSIGISQKPWEIRRFGRFFMLWDGMSRFFELCNSKSPTKSMVLSLFPMGWL
jgi:hypothetical protein